MQLGNRVQSNSNPLIKGEVIAVYPNGVDIVDDWTGDIVPLDRGDIRLSGVCYSIRIESPLARAARYLQEA